MHPFTFQHPFFWIACAMLIGLIFLIGLALHKNEKRIEANELDGITTDGSGQFIACIHGYNLKEFLTVSEKPIGHEQPAAGKPFIAATVCGEEVMVILTRDSGRKIGVRAEVQHEATRQAIQRAYEILYSAPVAAILQLQLLDLNIHVISKK